MSVRISKICIYSAISIFAFGACETIGSNYNDRFIPYTQEFARISGYDLLHPSETFLLPETLREISGLSLVNDSTVACIEDESGVIFYYSISKGEIVDQYRFERNGDFEGIEIVGNLAYVLKSNGTIYKYSFQDQTTEILSTPLKGTNNAEGLTFDRETNQLIIVLKGQAGIQSTMKGKAAYGYHLTHGFKPEPEFLITPEDFEAWNNLQSQPINMTKRKKGFMPSAIAIHPQTSEIYMLANVGKLLFVLTPKGSIKYSIPLSPRVFRQPEGICFTSKGDLIVSNEGQDGSGKILVFRKEGKIKGSTE